MESRPAVYAEPLPARLIRPKIKRAHYRTRLFNFLLDKTDASAWWICGPAGSGKTTLVNTFLEHCGLPCIWYEMDESDSDIASFFFYLAKAAECHISEDSPELPLMTSEYFQGIPVFTRRFFELLCSKIDQPCALVLDNYQEIREETMLHEILCNAILSVSSRLTIFVCSRQEPPAELIIPLSRCSLNVLGWNELKLEKEETREIAYLVTDKKFSGDELADLHSWTDGWVTGLVLFLRRSQFENIKPRLLSRETPQEIFDYFGMILFKKLDSYVQDVILRLSHVSRISVNTAGKLVGKDTAAILKTLYRQNAFVFRSITEEPIYFFHPLFKEFLQNHCKSHLSPEKLAEIQFKSAQAMAEEGQFEEAIQLFLMAGRAREAAGVILSGLIDAICFEANDYSQLDACIDKFHEFHDRWGSIDVPEIQLRITSAMLTAMVVRRSNSPEIKVWEEKAWQLVRSIEDATATLPLFIGLLGLKVIFGDFAGAKNVLDSFRDATWIKKAPLPFLFFQNLHTCYSWSVGRFEEGLKFARNGMEVEKKTGIRILNSALRIHGACSAMGSGNLSLARKYFDQATPMIKHQGNWNQVLYHCMRSWYELISGNRQEAKFHAWSCYKKSEAAGCTLTMSMTHGALAVVLYENNEYAAAAEQLDMGFEWSRSFRNPVFDFFGWLLRARFALDNQDESAADRALRQGFGIGRELDFRYFNHWMPQVMARLCAEALKKKIEVPYVRSLIRQHHLTLPEPSAFIEEWPWHVRLYSLGRFHIEIDEKPVIFSKKLQQRPLSLLKCLLAQGGKSVPSHTLQDLLWPDADGDAANNAYKTTLHRLRKILGDNQILHHSQGSLSFNQSLVWTDLQTFESFFESVEKCFHQNEKLMVNTLQEMLDQVLAIYCGPFLPGDLDAWTIPIRKNMHSRFVSILHRIGSALKAASDWESALTCFRKGLEIDPLVEPFYEHQIKILCCMGKKSEALLLYTQCRTILRSALGVSPSFSIRQLTEGGFKK
jgi:DNA-binding SARP family transcriptional activator